MNKLLFTLALYLLAINGFAQDKTKANELIEQGVKLHDAGQYTEAINLYRLALDADANNTSALYEMSYTYYISKNYDSAITIANKLLTMDASDDILKGVYVTLGSAYDDMNEPEKAAAMYKQGIKRFPDSYLLYFNLGITYYREDVSNKDVALESFQKAVAINPFHASSNYWQWQILKSENKIPAILTACMVCLAEQKTKRSQECAAFIQSTLTPKVKSDSSGKNITIYLPAASSKNKENDFSVAEMGLSLMAASSDILDSLHLKDQAAKLSFQLNALCNFLGESKKNKGFYWKFYAPFFHDLQEKKYIDMLSRLILMNTDKESEDWVDINTVIVNDFYDWLKDYKWPDKVK